MQNFTFHVGTKIFFGDGQIENLGEEIIKYGTHVLLVYGHKAIKLNGIYDAVIKELEKAHCEVTELSGVDPNPRITTVRHGIELCKDHGVDIILAVGGGSSIDCAKFIAAGYYYPGDPWDLLLDGSKIQKALPVCSVLTLSAAGSEMDATGVITNMETKEKFSSGASCLRPVFSILDPSYTNSVSEYQTASGSMDILSHIFEVYFNHENSYIQQQIAIALIKTVIKYAPIAYKDPTNYEARANLMWASSLAINDLICSGQNTGWTVHPLEHEFSAFYDIAHGMGLGILTPAWFDFILQKGVGVDLLSTLGKEIFGFRNPDDKYNAERFISNFRHFQKSLGIPTRLKPLGINDKNFELIATRVSPMLNRAFLPLSKEDILAILYKVL